MTRFLLCLLVLVAAAPVTAAAQRVRRGNVGRARQNRAEAIDNRLDLRHDRRDVMAIATIQSDWARAVSDWDRRAERRADALLQAWLGRELNESRRDGGEAPPEAAASHGERDGSRLEQRRSGTGADRRDLRDDRRDVRDVRDDRGDRRAARRDLYQTRRLAQELKRMQPAFDQGMATPTQYARKRHVLSTLAAIAEREFRQGRREVREDRREHHDDRSERYEDRERR